MLKRKDAITWDQYFMGLAHLSAQRSKDPSTQVGAVIVGADQKILSIGYNGLPSGLSDDDFPWAREGDFLNSKYAYVVHAELNAILNARSSLKNSRLYVSLFPCNECAKAIIQSGIAEVVYEDDKYADHDFVLASKKMLTQSGVSLRKLTEKIAVELTIENQD